MIMSMIVLYIFLRFLRVHLFYLGASAIAGCVKSKPREIQNTFLTECHIFVGKCEIAIFVPN